MSRAEAQGRRGPIRFYLALLCASASLRELVLVAAGGRAGLSVSSVAGDQFPVDSSQFPARLPRFARNDRIRVHPCESASERPPAVHSSQLSVHSKESVPDRSFSSRRSAGRMPATQASGDATTSAWPVARGTGHESRVTGHGARITGHGARAAGAGGRKKPWAPVPATEARGYSGVWPKSVVTPESSRGPAAPRWGAGLRFRGASPARAGRCASR